MDLISYNTSNCLRTPVEFLPTAQMRKKKKKKKLPELDPGGAEIGFTETWFKSSRPTSGPKDPEVGRGSSSSEGNPLTGKQKPLAGV